MDLLIYGYGGLAKVIIDIAITLHYQHFGIFDDAIANQYTDVNLHFLGHYCPETYPNTPIIIAIGNNNIREQIANKISHKPISLVHPTAQISPNAMVEHGSIIMQNVVIQSHAKIGKFAIINPSVVVDHEVVLEDFVHLRALCYIGSNTHLSEKTTIAPNQFVERFSKL